MPLKETLLEKAQNPDLSGLEISLTRKARVFLWESGQGKALNCLPKKFGSQLLLSIPANGTRLPLHYIFRDQVIFAFLTEDEANEIRQSLLENSAAEVWLPNGWYSVTAEFLSKEERETFLSEQTWEQLYGTIGANLPINHKKIPEILMIARTAARTGENGPGSRSWIWLAVSGILFGLLLKKNRKH